MPMTSHRGLLLALLVSAGLAVVAFWPAMGNGFVYDDDPFIIYHPAVSSHVPWYRCWLERVWPRGMNSDNIYRPLTLWSYRINAQATGGTPSPRAFHAVNLALHAITSALVTLLAYRILTYGQAMDEGANPGGSKKGMDIQVLAALSAGALFATHPIHTEAVATGYGRSELLAALFSVWLLTRYLTVFPTSSPQSRPAISHPHRFHLINAGLFLAAIMSKENAALLWPILVMIDLFRRRQSEQRSMTWREWLNDRVGPAHADFLLAIAVFLFLRYLVFGWNWYVGADQVRIWESPVSHATWVEHLLTPFRLLTLSVELLLWPPWLCPVWSIPALSLPISLSGDVLVGMAITLLLLIGAIVLWRQGRIHGPLLAGLLLLMSLAIHAIPAAHWLFAERWLYLPTTLAAALLAVIVVRGGAILVGASLALAIALLPMTWHYTTSFHDNLTLAETVVRRQPNSFLGWKMNATLLCGKGRYNKAILAANQCISVFDDTPRYRCPRDPYVVLVRSYLALGDIQKAITAIEAHDRAAVDVLGPVLIQERQQLQKMIDRLPPPTSPHPTDKNR